MKIRVFVSGLLAAVVSLCVMAAAASAATLMVNTTSDPDNGVGSCATGGACSLREAVNQANADASGDTISVPANSAPYTLDHTLGALTFTADATVTGAGASSTAINGDDGSGSTQIMQINSGSVTVQDVTLEHGNSSDRGGAARVNAGTLALNNDLITGNASHNGGGAIEANAPVSVSNSTFNSNTTSASGGAIELLSFASTGTVGVSVTNSTLSGNTASGNGGAIYSENTSTGTAAVTVDHSTLTGNNAAGSGGALEDNSGAVTMTVSDSTIVGNTARNAGGGGDIGNSSDQEVFTNDTVGGNAATGVGAPGGDFWFGGGVKPVFTNTIIAAGAASSGPDCGGVQEPTSQGHNIDQQNGCGFGAAGDQVTNPRLGSLADNGGPTQTTALQPGSPAIDAGTNTGCPTTDQRGVARPQGAACDIGAYEVAPPSASTGAATGVGTTAATMNATASNPDAVAATVTFQYGTTTSYGSTVTKSAAALSGSTGYSATLSSLQPNTTYHYRVVVTNPDGTSTGQDQTFTTTATTTTTPPPPSNSFSIGKRHVSKNGTITLKLSAPDAGSFKGKATFKAHHKKFTYGAGSKSAGGASTVTLTIKLKRHARKELLKLGHATVSIAITFTPTGGTPSHKTIKLKIKVKHGHFT